MSPRLMSLRMMVVRRLKGNCSPERMRRTLALAPFIALCFAASGAISVHLAFRHHFGGDWFVPSAQLLTAFLWGVVVPLKLRRRLRERDRQEPPF